MNILGLFISGPNPASCLIKDNKLIAFAEEERFNRIKMSTNIVPFKSSQFCLEKGKLSLSDLNFITIGWDHNKYPKVMSKFFKKNMENKKKDSYSRIYETISLNEKSPEFQKKKLQMIFRKNGYNGKFPKIIFQHHHLSHAYSVYYNSPFSKSIIFIIDGSGEELATSVWLGNREKISCIEKNTLPHSFGYFFGAITEFLGFSMFSGEGKVMGLAPYGNSNPDIRKKLKKFFYLENYQVKIDPEYIYFDKRSYNLRFTDKLVKLFNKKPRTPESKISQWHKDLAYESQYILEDYISTIIRKYINETGIRNVCISGGVAMNCKMNGVINDLPEIENCYVYSASYDAGVALGSAIMISDNKKKIKKNISLSSVYQGKSFSNLYIKKMLNKNKISNFTFINKKNLLSNVAQELLNGKIIGWFQGRAEVGARSLGNRSILANPTIKNMKNILNREVKNREFFRPFAPSILIEYSEEYFKLKSSSKDYFQYRDMLVAATAKKNVKNKIPAVVHVDNTVRPQIVSRSSNQLFYELIKEFYNLSSVPLLLNTSFNVRGEPIINSPEEALRCFYSSGIDILVIENFIVRKNEI